MRPLSRHWLIFLLSFLIAVAVSLKSALTRAYAAGLTYTLNSTADTDDGVCDVTNCTVPGANSATSHDGEGGALYKFGEVGHATTSVKNSRLSGNSAVLSSGGILNARVGNNTTPLSATITIGSTIFKAAGGDGKSLVSSPQV